MLAESIKLHNKNEFQFFCIYFFPWKSQMVKALDEGGAEVHCFEARNNFQILLQYKKIISFCQEKKIDVVHCHLPWSGFLGRIIHEKSHIPLIYTEHNIQEHYHPVTKNLNKFSFNSQNLAIGVSADVSRSIKKNIDPTIPVKTVLNGVNTFRFQKDREKGFSKRKDLSIPFGAVVVGTIAVFREQKSILDWVKAFKEVNKEHPDTYGIIVGAGPQKEKIQNRVHELELTKRIIMPGLQTDTVSYFSAMDIYMMSSKFEGLPIALLEAMSMECAVVSTRAGGVTEVVRNELDGLLCDVGDYISLAGHVKTLIKDPLLQKKLQQNARERVKSDFSLETMVQQLENIYRTEVNLSEEFKGNGKLSDGDKRS